MFVRCCSRPQWIDNELDRTCNSAALRSAVRSIWDRLVDRLLESTAVRSREAWNPVELVDGLAESLLFRRRMRTGNRPLGSKGLADCFNGAGDPSDSYRRHALAEEKLRSRRANYVVYGHTHQTEFSPLESNSPERQLQVPIYFNTGAWHPVISPTHRSSADTLSFVTFYQQDERSGCPFETWTGSWGQISAGNKSFSNRRQSCRSHASSASILPADLQHDAFRFGPRQRVGRQF